jgi:multiple antibiotic resistance protein
VHAFDNLWQFSLVALSSIFFLVDPFAALPAFLAMTAGDSPERRRQMARRASWTCFFVLTAFAVTGKYIFALFGLTLPAFEIAGGLILLLIGIEMIQAKRSATQEHPRERQEGEEKEDISITPLGVPMLAGPGAISTVMVLMGPQPVWWKTLGIIGCIAITALLSFIVLAAASRVRGFLGETGINILVRIFGLLLTAIAVQFALNGLMHLGVIEKVTQ